MDIQILSKFERGKGIWSVKLEYALPVYSIDFLYNSSELDIVYTIDEDLLLELLLFKIRAQTIKFATKLKKADKSLEKDLMNKIVGERRI